MKFPIIRNEYQNTYHFEGVSLMIVKSHKRKAQEHLVSFRLPNDKVITVYLSRKEAAYVIKTSLKFIKKDLA